MVKYLSDQRNDPYYQTKLSLSQPFEAEVPQKMYPVDEVDLGPALNMIETGARAYYAHQGEELERENLGISYSMYQAGRAKEKAQTAAAEKEKGLKNTMLNDYAIAISREVLDPYMQGNGQMSPVAAERKLRDIREQYIRMTGGVLNASDLMKIEKDSGVTFTKDLYQADLKNQNEIRKEERADYKANVKAIYKAEHPGVDVDRVPFSEQAQYASQLAELENGVIVGAQTDASIIANSDDPKVTSGNYISGGTQTSLRNFAQNRFETWRRIGMSQNTYWSSSQLLDFKQAAENELANSEINVNGVSVKLGEIYSPDIISGVINDAYVRSGIEKPYTQEQAALAATSTEIENINKYNKGKYVTPLEIQNEYEAQQDIATMRRIAGPAMIFFRGSNPESSLLALNSVNEELAKRITTSLNAYLEGNQALGRIDGLSTGEAFATSTKQIGVIDKNGELFLSNVAVDNGKAIVNGTGMYQYKPVTRWDVQMADAAMQNKDTILLNGKEDPSSEAAETKEENTKVTLELYRRMRANQEWWDSVKPEDQEKLTRWYTDATNSVAYRNLALLNKEGLAENIAYDASSNRFVPINLNEAKGSQKHTTLWKVIDTLNGLTHTGLEEFDDTLVKALRAKAEDGMPVIRDITDSDKVVPISSTVNFARALGRGETSKAIGAAPLTIVEGMSNVGESVTKGALWLAEKGSEGAVLSAIYGFGKAQEAGEAFADVVDFATNPDRTYVGEFKQAVKNAADSFADYVLEDTDLTEEQKEEAKQEFREQIKDAANVAKEKGGDFLELIGYNNTERDRQLQHAVNVAYDKIVKTFGDMYETYKLGKQYGRMSSIPAYNLGIIARIMGGDKNVSKEEAEASLEAMKKAPVSDLMSLDANFDIGMFDLNTRARIEEYINTLDKHEKKRGSVSGKVDNMAPMNAEAIYNITKGAKNVSKEEAEAALKAWDKATTSDKRVIEKDLRMYSSEIKKALEDAAK